MTSPHRTSDLNPVQPPPLAEGPNGTATGEPHVILRRILWATDFSPCSDAALNHALAIARRYGSHLYLAHVIRPESFELVVPEAVHAMVSEARRDAEDEMARLLVTGRLRGVSHRVTIGMGAAVWPVLSKIVQDNEIDLIVVGTHGRTGFRKLLVGSVAQQIFRSAPCPVFTVGPKVYGEMGEEVAVRRILHATNFTAAAQESTRYALSLAEENRSDLFFMHVVEEGDDLSSERRLEATQSVSRELRELVPPSVFSRVDPQLIVEFGSPAEIILKTAERLGADMIVLGGREHSRLFGPASSDTAYKVVCGAICPVFTVPGGLPEKS